LKPPAVVPIVERLRRDRPENSFVISARTGWDPQGMDPGLIGEENAAFEVAGIQHMVAAPWQKDLDAWLRSMDLLAEIVRPSAMTHTSAGNRTKGLGEAGRR